MGRKGTPNFWLDFESLKQEYLMKDIITNLNVNLNLNSNFCQTKSRNEKALEGFHQVFSKFNVNLFLIYDGLIPEEVNVRSSLVLRNVFSIVIEVQGLPQDLDTASGHPTLHRARLK